MFNKKTDARGGGRLVSEARLDPWGHGVEVALYEPHTKCLIQIQCYPKKFCGSATQIGKPNFTCKSLLFLGMMYDPSCRNRIPLMHGIPLDPFYINASDSCYFLFQEEQELNLLELDDQYYAVELNRGGRGNKDHGEYPRK